MTFEEFKAQYEYKPVVEHSNHVGNRPMVSICVMTYNQEKYIRECLEGILVQRTNFPFEILLGDDDSSDGTREICLEYAKRYPTKIRLFLHDRENNIRINGNFTGRFNFLYNLYAAKGKYLAICEGDDYWIDPLKLQKQVDFLDANPACMLCFHSVLRVFEDKSRTDKIDRPRGRMLDEQMYSSAEIIKGGLQIHTASMVLRSIMLNNIPDWFYSAPGGDIALILLCANRGKIGFLEDTMSVYRTMALNSWTATKRSRQWYDNHLRGNITLLSSFDAYSRYTFSKEIAYRKEKSMINYLLNIQDYCHKLEVAKLLISNFTVLTKFKYPITIRVWMRFFLGRKLYRMMMSAVYKKMNNSTQLVVF